MRFQKLAARSAGLLCALLTAACSAIPCGAIWDDVILPGEDEPEKETFTSGDYVYSRMVGVEDENKKAACIEKYTGEDEDVVIPGELDGLEVVMLGDNAFASNHSITSVTIPASVIGFGSYTFAECTAIKEYRVEDGNPFCVSRNGVLYTTDGTGLLRYPMGTLGEEVTIEEGIVSIGNAAFAGALGLKSVKLPSTLETLGICTFAECQGLTRVEIPEKVTEIPEFCFNGCKGLVNIILPDGLLTIGDAAFVNTGLLSLSLPEHLQTIGQQAFANSALKTVTIPKSVVSIGSCAFGWKVNALNELVTVDNFVIRGYQGSTAEQYASDYDEGNNFNFETIAEAQQQNPETKQNKKASKTGKVIAIVLCCILLAAVIPAAVLSEKRRKEREAAAAKEAKKQAKKEKRAAARAAAENDPAELPADTEEAPETPDEGSETE